jgi:hypothetical protein
MDSLASFGYSNNQSDGVLRKIDAYQPYGDDRWLWGEVRDDVRSAVRAATPTDVDDAGMKLGTVFRYFAWCHSVAGVEIVVPGIFNSSLIDRYVTHAKSHCKENTRRRLAQRLSAIKANIVRESANPTKHEGRPPRAFVATDAELRSARDWASALPSARLRHNADVIISLAAGAGLTTSEIESARLRHFTTSGGLLAIQVGSRSIPVRRDWSERLSKRLRPRGADDLLLQWDHQDGSTTHVMTTFPHADGRPDPSKLRGSYIASLLNARIPVTDVLRVSGLQHAASLDRYLPFVLPIEGIDELLAGTKVESR